MLDAFFDIQSLIQVLAEGMRQLANFNPAHLIDDYQLIFEFVRSQAAISRRAKQLVTELEDAQVRVPAGPQAIEERKKASEELGQRLAQDGVDLDDSPRALETEKADLKARSRSAESKIP